MSVRNIKTGRTISVRNIKRGRTISVEKCQNSTPSKSRNPAIKMDEQKLRNMTGWKGGTKLLQKVVLPAFCRRRCDS
jgi:hypothetical protein